jgi:hypothetical protein
MNLARSQQFDSDVDMGVPMRLSAIPSRATCFLLAALSLGACGKIKENTPSETAQTRAEAKRHKDACASSTAYDRMKRVIFDQARQQSSHRKNLDTLEAFSFVRMEAPVVEGWDPTLDLTRCKGRIVLDIPPGSEQAFGGERRLLANIAYTAQAAADASGLVYAMTGVAPIVSKLAAFSLSDSTYRPLPAVDTSVAKTDLAGADEPSTEASSQLPPSTFGSARTDERERDAAPAFPSPSDRVPVGSPTIANPSRSETHVASDGEATVRTFYNALGTGSGDVASAQVIPQKRSSRAYSADAISRFYGRLPEPLRLTSVSLLQGGAYRVTYHYAAPGVRCNGSAIVRLTPGGSRPLIRSIKAANGC